MHVSFILVNAATSHHTLLVIKKCQFIFFVELLVKYNVEIKMHYILNE